MKSIYYWSPCLNRVGTYFAVKNSLISLSKYSRSSFDINIINVCGEWNEEKDFFSKNNINVIDLNYSYFKFLPKTGYFLSRLSYFLIYLLSAIPLIIFLFKSKPKFFIAHLLTSLPLLLFKIFNFKTKLVLRISGFPRLNFIRKNFWKILSNKIYKITCPTKELKKQILEKKIFSPNKVFFLPDPIIHVKKFNKNLVLRDSFYDLNKKKYFLAVGRLTKQKNFKYLINEFSQFLKINSNYELLIFGEGELKYELHNLIEYLNISHKVHLMGYEKNIYLYMKNAQAFILSSLWEDPGFVLIEAAFNNLFIISSNCKNGPSEFLQNGEGGILFQSNVTNQLKNSLQEFCKLTPKSKKNKKLKIKKSCKNYTLLNHHTKLCDEILNY